jgi:Tfp pilus assembly protein PilO
MKFPIIPVITFVVLTVLFIVAVALFAAEPPKPDLLSACQAELSVTSQFALQMRDSRNQAEQELARTRARMAALEEQLAKATGKPEPKK